MLSFFSPRSRKLTGSPRSLGYRMPAEWEEHAGTWLAWPHHHATWTAGQWTQIEAVYREMLRALLPYEEVYLLVQNRAEENRIRALVRAWDIPWDSLRFYQASTADVWIRDYGPTFLKDGAGAKAWCKWRFNAWGRKYKDRLRDDQVFSNGKLARPAYFLADFIMEGGAIEVNGKGVCLTTESCLLNANRNPALSREDIEKRLSDYLGITEVVWLKRGILGDDTDGHIDVLARFVSENTVVAAYTENSEDPNYEILKENWAALEVHQKKHKKPWRLIRLPVPDGRMFVDGQIHPATYANFYIANQTVLLPVYQQPQDVLAESIFAEVFPSRKIVRIDCRALVSGCGALHCITQQEPR